MSEATLRTAVGPTEKSTDLTLSWDCAFCPKTRVYEGGCPLALSLDECPTCGSKVAVSCADREALKAATNAAIVKHLI